MNNSKIVSIFFLFLMVSNTVMAEEPNGAKALFYSGEGTEISSWNNSSSKKVEKTTSKTASNQYMGVEYWIDLEGADGKRSRVPINYVFHSGDRFKLSLRSNTNGYLYVLNFGSGGSTNILFPRSNMTDNYVKAFEPSTIPYNSFLKFDATPGEETILIMLSPQPITDLPSASPGSKPTYAQYAAFTSNTGAKDIVLEEDNSSATTPTQYAIAPTKTLESGKVIPIYIKIKHQ